MSQHLTDATADQRNSGTLAEEIAARLDVSGTTCSVVKSLLTVPLACH